MPCAVCKRVTQAAKTLIVPGTYQCPSGFSADYRGYLMAPHHTHPRGEHVCVDDRAEGGSSSVNEGGHYLYPVEADTGSAGIQGYAGGMELSCVVCGSTSSGSVYTRWGRSSCPAGHSKVYSGPVAGPHYSHAGGGANLLCLTPIPKSLAYKAGLQSAARLFRTEYEISNNIGTLNSLNDHEAVCAVCQAPAGRQYSMTVHGSTSCPSGFSADYIGYLMSDKHDHYRRKYTCVDQAPEKTGSSRNENGALLYIVETESGGHAIPGYSQYYEVTCAHCTVSSSAGGSAYLHAGSKRCPSAHKTLYSGALAGSYYGHRGSGADLVCMTSVPRYLSTNSGNAAGAIVYNTEYEFSNAAFPSLIAKHDYDVPCSWCQRPLSRSHSLTVPAKRECPSGFTAEFYGFLVSERHNHGKGTYICLPATANIMGSKSNQNGALLYQVEMAESGRPVGHGYIKSGMLACVQCGGYTSGEAPPPPPPPPKPPLAGETYVRWGRTTCPSSARAVYVGFAAGAHHTHGGSGSNLQCMPQDPEFRPGSFSSADEHGGILYTAEYRTSESDLSAKWKNLNLVDIPCVLCQRVAAGAKTLMVCLGTRSQLQALCAPQSCFAACAGSMSACTPRASLYFARAPHLLTHASCRCRAETTVRQGSPATTMACSLAHTQATGARSTFASMRTPRATETQTAMVTISCM